jgi:hypothetical protein
VGSGEALVVGVTEGADVAGSVGVDVETGTGVAHGPLGTGTGVADPAPAALALALGTGAAEVAAVGQDELLGTGSGVAGIPVGLAEGALTVAETLGVADALGDAFLLA